MAGHKRLDQILLALGWISEAQMCRALAHQKEHRGWLGEILVKEGYVSESQLLEALAEHFDVPVARWDDGPVDPQLFDILPLPIAEEYSCLPFAYDPAAQTMCVAFADPRNHLRLKAVSEAIDPVSLIPHVALLSRIQSMLAAARGTDMENVGYPATSADGSSVNDRKIDSLLDLLELALTARGTHPIDHTSQHIWAARLAGEIAQRTTRSPDVCTTVRLAALLADIADWEQRTPADSDDKVLLQSADFLETLKLPWDVAGVLRGCARTTATSSENAEAAEILRVARAIARTRHEFDGTESLDQWRTRLQTANDGSLQSSLLTTAFTVLRARSLHGHPNNRPAEILLAGTDPFVEQLGDRFRQLNDRVINAQSWPEVLTLVSRRTPDIVCIHTPTADIPEGTLGEQPGSGGSLNPKSVLFLVDTVIPDAVSRMIGAGARAIMFQSAGVTGVVGRVQRMLSQAGCGEVKRREKSTKKTSDPGVTGRLDELGLADLVQVLSATQKSAHVILSHHGQEASLWFDRGEIVHAASKTKQGEELFYELLGWDKGRFEVHTVRTCPPRNVPSQTTALLLEGVRRLDEARKHVAPAKRCHPANHGKPPCDCGSLGNR